MSNRQGAVSRARLAALLAAVGIAACGGGGADEARTVPSSPPDSSNSGGGGGIPNAGGGGGTPAPTPTPPAPAGPAWGSEQTLAAGSTIVEALSLDAAGSARMRVRDTATGTVSQGGFDTSGAWAAVSALDGLAPHGGPYGFGTRGTLFGGAVTDTTVTGTTPTWQVRGSTVSGGAQALPAMALSTVSMTLTGAPQVHVDAAGGTTVFWIVYGDTFATLYARRRLGNTWGALTTVTTGPTLVGLTLLSAADGSARLGFARGTTTLAARPSSTIQDQVWTLPISTQGVLGTMTRVDNASGGRSDGSALTGGISNIGGVFLWPMAATGGGECLYAQLYQGGLLAGSTCVNSASRLEGLGQFGRTPYKNGLTSVWWTSDTGGLRAAYLTTDYLWETDAGLVAKNEVADVSQMVNCPTGVSALVWRHPGGTLYGMQRDTAGVWGTKVTLAPAGMPYGHLQVRTDDACRFTVAWTQGSGSVSVVTRGWQAGDAAPEAPVVHATGVVVPPTADVNVANGIVSLVVEPSGGAVIAWQNQTDGRTHWRVQE